MEKLYTTHEAAEYLGVTRQNIKQHLSNGNLKPDMVAGKSYLFTKESLDALRPIMREKRKKPVVQELHNPI